jgi:hypothetical protein
MSIRSRIRRLEEKIRGHVARFVCRFVEVPADVSEGELPPDVRAALDYNRSLPADAFGVRATIIGRQPSHADLADTDARGG